MSSNFWETPGGAGTGAGAPAGGYIARTHQLRAQQQANMAMLQQQQADQLKQLNYGAANPSAPAGFNAPAPSGGGFSVGKTVSLSPGFDTAQNAPKFNTAPPDFGVPKTQAPEVRVASSNWFNTFANGAWAAITAPVAPFLSSQKYGELVTAPGRAIDAITNNQTPDWFGAPDTFVGQQERELANAYKPALQAYQQGDILTGAIESQKANINQLAISQIPGQIKQAIQQPSATSITGAVLSLPGALLPFLPKVLGPALNSFVQGSEGLIGSFQGAMPREGDSLLTRLAGLATPAGAAATLKNPAGALSVLKESLNAYRSGDLELMKFVPSVDKQAQQFSDTLGADYSLKYRSQAGFFDKPLSLSTEVDPGKWASYQTRNIAFSSPEARNQANARILAGEDPTVAMRGAQMPGKDAFPDEVKLWDTRVSEFMDSKSRIAQANALQAGVPLPRAQQIAADAREEAGRLINGTGMIPGEENPLAEMIGQQAVGFIAGKLGIDPMAKIPLHKMFGVERFMPEASSTRAADLLMRTYDAAAKDAMGVTGEQQMTAMQTGVSPSLADKITRAQRLYDTSTNPLTRGLAGAVVQAGKMVEFTPQTQANIRAGHALDVVSSLVTDAPTPMEVVRRLGTLVAAPEQLADEFGNLPTSVKAEIGRKTIEQGLDQITNLPSMQTDKLNPLQFMAEYAELAKKSAREVTNAELFPTGKPETNAVERLGQTVKGWMGEFYLRTPGYILRNTMSDWAIMAQDGLLTFDGYDSITNHLAKFGITEKQITGVGSMGDYPSKLGKIPIIGDIQNKLGAVNEQLELGRRTRAFYSAFTDFWGLNWAPGLSEGAKTKLGPELAGMATELENAWRSGTSPKDIRAAVDRMINPVHAGDTFSPLAHLDKAGLPHNALSPEMILNIETSMAELANSGASPEQIDAAFNGHEYHVMQQFRKHLVGLGDVVNPKLNTERQAIHDMDEYQAVTNQMVQGLVRDGAMQPDEARAQVDATMQPLVAGEVAIRDARTKLGEAFAKLGNAADPDKVASLVQHAMDQEYSLRKDYRDEQGRLLRLAYQQQADAKAGDVNGRAMGMRAAWDAYRAANGDNARKMQTAIQEAHGWAGGAIEALIAKPDMWETLAKERQIETPGAYTDRMMAETRTMLEEAGSIDDFNKMVQGARLSVDLARRESYRAATTIAKSEPKLATQIFDVMVRAERDVQDNATLTVARNRLELQRKDLGVISFEDYNKATKEHWDDHFQFARERFGDYSQSQLVWAQARNSEIAAGLRANGFDDNYIGNLFSQMMTPEGKVRLEEALTRKLPLQPMPSVVDATPSRTRIRDGIDTAFANVPDDQRQAAMFVLDARAQAWASANGRNPEEWYQTRLADVVRGETPAAEAEAGTATQPEANPAPAQPGAGKPKDRQALAEEQIMRQAGINSKEAPLKQEQPVNELSKVPVKRGAVEFLEDGRAVIRAFESPDISTLMHEIGHVFRRDLDGRDADTMGEWAGAKYDAQTGEWTWNKAAEEKFARGFEEYLAKGRAPHVGLQGVFERFKGWMSTIYQKARGLIEGKMNPDMQDVFDRMLTDHIKQDAPPTTVEEFAAKRNIRPDQLTPDTLMALQTEAMKVQRKAQMRADFGRLDSLRLVEGNLPTRAEVHKWITPAGEARGQWLQAGGGGAQIDRSIQDAMQRFGFSDEGTGGAAQAWFDKLQEARNVHRQIRDLLIDGKRKYYTSSKAAEDVVGAWQPLIDDLSRRLETPAQKSAQAVTDAGPALPASEMARQVLEKTGGNMDAAVEQLTVLFDTAPEYAGQVFDALQTLQDATDRQHVMRDTVVKEEPARKLLEPRILTELPIHDAAKPPAPADQVAELAARVDKLTQMLTQPPPPEGAQVPPVEQTFASPAEAAQPPLPPPPPPPPPPPKEPMPSAYYVERVRDTTVLINVLPKGSPQRNRLEANRDAILAEAKTAGYELDIPKPIQWDAKLRLKKMYQDQFEGRDLNASAAEVAAHILAAIDGKPPPEPVQAAAPKAEAAPKDRQTLAEETIMRQAGINAEGAPAADVPPPPREPLHKTQPLDFPHPEDLGKLHDAETDTTGDKEGIHARHLVDAATKLQVDAIAAIRDGFKEHLKNFKPDRVVEPAKRQLLRDEAARIAQEYYDTLNAGKTYAKHRTDFSLLDYGQKRGADKALSLVAPFSYWGTRQGRNYAIRLLSNPSLLAAYWRFKDGLEKENKRKGLRQRFGAGIQVPGTNTYIDPMSVMFPFANLVHEDVNQVEGGKTGMQAGYDMAAMMGLRPSPIIDIPLRYSNALVGQQPGEAGYDDSKTIYGRSSIGNLIPQTGMIQGATAMAGIGGPMGVNIEAPARRAIGLPEATQWDPYRVARSVADMAALENQQNPDGFDQKPYLLAQEWIQNHKDTDLPTALQTYDATKMAAELRVDPAIADRALQIARMAASQAMQQRGISTLSSSLLGLSAQNLPPGEAARTDQKQLERAAAYNPSTGVGSREDVATVQKAYPALQVARGQYGALPGDQADAGKLYDQAQRQAINQQYDALKDSVVAARPWDRKAAGKIEQGRIAALNSIGRDAPADGTAAWQAEFQKTVAGLTGQLPDAVAAREYRPLSIAGATPKEALTIRQNEVMRYISATQPTVEAYTKEDGTIDGQAYSQAVRDWRGNLATIAAGIPQVGMIVDKADTEKSGPALREWLGGLSGKAVDEYRRRNDSPIEAAQRAYFDNVYTPTLDAYRQAKDGGMANAYDATIGAVGPQTSADLIANVQKLYPGRWTADELQQQIGKMTMPKLTDVMRGNMSEAARTKDAARSEFWDYLNNNTPPGAEGAKLRNQPLIAAALDQSSRSTLTTEQYQLALNMARGWMQENVGPVTPQETQEWAQARAARKQLDAVIISQVGNDGALALRQYEQAPDAQTKEMIRRANPAVDKALAVRLVFAKKNPVYAKYYRSGLKVRSRRGGYRRTR